MQFFKGDIFQDLLNDLIEAINVPFEIKYFIFLNYLNHIHFNYIADCLKDPKITENQKYQLMFLISNHLKSRRYDCWNSDYEYYETFCFNEIFKSILKSYLSQVTNILLNNSKFDKFVISKILFYNFNHLDDEICKDLI